MTIFQKNPNLDLQGLKCTLRNSLNSKDSVMPNIREIPNLAICHKLSKQGKNRVKNHTLDTKNDLKNDIKSTIQISGLVQHYNMILEPKTTKLCQNDDIKTCKFMKISKFQTFGHKIAPKMTQKPLKMAKNRSKS